MTPIRGVTLPVCSSCGKPHQGLEPHRMDGAIVYKGVIYIDYVTCPTTGERVYVVIGQEAK